jgi:outer membrane protein assembly factor BamB
MNRIPALRRLLTLAATASVFGLVLGFVLSRRDGAGPLGPSRAQADAAAEGRSWPLFGGTVQRNLVNLVEKDIPDTWSVQPGSEKNLKWAVDLGSKAYGGPIVHRGKIFVGTNNNNPRDPAIKGDKGVLMCFRESDGKFLWQLVFDKLPAGRVNDWPEEGICSAPVGDGDRIYFVNNRGEVICATTEGLAEGRNIGVTDEQYKGKGHGDIVWRLDMIRDLGVFPHNLATCSPLIVGDTLFVITSNGVDEGHINIPAPAAPSFIAVDKKSGKVLWKDNSPSVRAVGIKKGGDAGQKQAIKELVDKGLVLMHGQWSNPVYAEAKGKPQIIFPGGDGWIYSFNPKDGSLLWKFDCNPKNSFYALGGEGTRNDFVSTPVVWENKLYIGVGQDPEHNKGIGHLWCIDITREPKNADKDVSPASKMVAGAKQLQTIFDPKDPANKDSALVWHFGGEAPEDAQREFLFGRTLSTCAVHDGLVYAGEYDGIVHCLDALTGKQYWEHDMDRSDTWSSCYWVDGKVYIGNEKGRMLVFQHGKEKKLRNVIDMGRGGTKIRATPVAANGVLYVMTENPCRLYAVTKK